MKFIKDNWIVLSFILLTIVSEVGHLPFSKIPFKGDLCWDAPVYYFLAQLGLITFWPALVFFLLIDKQKKASKCMAFGLVVWNVKELIDELAYMANYNVNVFELNSTFWAQIVFILSIIGLSALFFSRWKY